jgi:hypothetical protein
MPGKVGRPLSLAGSIGARTPNFAVDPTVSVWVLMVSQLEPQEPAAAVQPDAFGGAVAPVAPRLTGADVHDCCCLARADPSELQPQDRVQPRLGMKQPRCLRDFPQWPERTQTFTDDSVHKALNPIRPL